MWASDCEWWNSSDEEKEGRVREGEGARGVWGRLIWWGVVDWFLAGGRVVGIVLDGGVVGTVLDGDVIGVDVVGAGGWEHFFEGGGGIGEVCSSRIFCNGFSNRAGFVTSITVPFSGFSFVVSVVLVFFWGRFMWGGRLLTVPAVWLRALYHHHHLSFPDKYGIWDGFEDFPIQTNLEYCPGSKLQLWYIVNVAVGADE